MRRLIVRLERGEALGAAIASIARTHEVLAGSVSGTGVLDEVAIAPFDPERGRYGAPRVLRGRVEMVSLTGSIAWDGNAPAASLSVVLAREGDRGLEVIAGRLEAAKAIVASLVVECWDDVTLERIVDGATGLEAWSIEGGAGTAAAPPHAPAATPAAPARETPSAPKSLGDAARALEAMPARDLPPELGASQPEPEPGDFLDHPSFGLVEVEADADQGRLRIKLPSGSRREILLEVFDVVARTPHQGHRTWSLRPRKR